MTTRLQELSEAVGVSGKEDAVRKIILEAIRDYASEIRVDAIGNLTAVQKGTGRNRPRVMLAAHMDEIGLMITSMNGDGLMKFTSIGGVDERILPGLRVKIGDDGVPGVIIWTPIHKNRDQNAAALSSLRIDIGASSKDEAAGKVRVGNRVVFDSRYMEIGETMLRGKAFDDRVGCSLLIDILRGGPYPVDVLAAFTVQEEIGLRGAKVAAQRLRPDAAIVLEGTTANDIPSPQAGPDDIDPPNPVCRLGDGPVLTVMDRSMIVYPPLLNFLRQTAEKNGIPYQLKTLAGGGTDGGSIHTTTVGVPTAVVSMPCRYIHSPSAYLNRTDYDHTLKLAQAALRDLKWETLRTS